jgi:methyltransferase (TIGR00027 family)
MKNTNPESPGRQNKESSLPHHAGRTAFGTIVEVALEQYTPEEQRLVQDEVAYKFLPFGMQCVLTALIERRAPGVAGGILCRKRYIDDKVPDALRAGIGAVVNLGAGLDTRGYRFPALNVVPVFEVDLPESIEYKKKILQRVCGRIPANVHLVPMDFRCEDLADILPASGYPTGEKSFFIWEGVTQYLPEAAVRKTFDFLSRARTGSRMVFTYVRRDFIDGTALYGSDRLFHEFRVKEQVWQWGLLPEQVVSFLKDYSWKELEQAGSQEYQTLYLKPSGRILPVMMIERTVYAEKI